MMTMFFMMACIGELPEEQFEKYVLLTHNGWIEQDVQVSNDYTASFPIVVSISGTSKNKEHVGVKLAYEPELLERYNIEKYKLQEDLYYAIVPEDAISFKTDLQIADGEESTLTDLVIDFNKITDPYKDYVLPIRVVSTDKYSLQELESASILKRSEALYHIRRVNDFSGDYSGSSTVYQTSGRGTDQSPYNNKGTGTPVPLKTLYALSDSECYFFAGQFDRNNVFRNDFIVKVQIDANDSVIFSSPNPALQLRNEPSSMVTVRKNLPTDERYEIVTKVFSFSYTYYDLTDKSDSTASNNHILRAVGTMSRERKELKE